MEDELNYYIYLLIISIVITHSFLLNKLSSYALIIESLLFFAILVFSVYLIYSFEKKASDVYQSTLIFFAIVALNDIIMYSYTQKILPLLFSFLCILGIYMTILSIPETQISKKQNTPMIYEETGKGDYIFNDKMASSKVEIDDVNDDVMDESEIVIEEIKPMKDLNSKKGKKSVGKKKLF